jgi:hypothetical protein
MSLREEMVSRIAGALQRKSITSCSRWAKAYRIMSTKGMAGNWTFKYHPWLKEMHDCTSEQIVGQKAAQMGFTETALNLVLYKMDVQGVDCLYLLPNKHPDSRDFSAARLDPAINLSDHLKMLFSNVKNVGHKQAGSVNLYIRGSRSASGLKSIPVGLIIFDEVDEMFQDNIPLAMERMSGQLEKQYMMISTPTIDGYGINEYFQETTQEFFSFQCPSCSRWTSLEFPECLVITANELTDPNLKNSHLICKECKNTLPHQTKTDWLANGKWVAQFPGVESRGFKISQLYSSTIKPADLGKAWIKAQSSASDEQEFYNSKLGVPHVVSGSSITEAQVNDTIRSYRKADVIKRNSSRVRTMGVDVGKWFHVEIDEWIIKDKFGPDINVKSKAKVLLETKVVSIDEVDRLMRQYEIDVCVIDAQPERRIAKEFADRFTGRAYMCFYSQGAKNKNINRSRDPYDPNISVDRSSWLDLSQGRFMNNTIILPADTSKEYREQIQKLTKIYKEDNHGNPVGKYISRDKQDHFAHARNYAEIALPLAASRATNQDIGSFL